MDLLSPWQQTHFQNLYCPYISINVLAAKLILGLVSSIKCSEKKMGRGKVLPPATKAQAVILHENTCRRRYIVC